MIQRDTHPREFRSAKAAPRDAPRRADRPPGLSETATETTWSAHEQRERRIAETAGRRHGVVSTAELRDLGLSPAGITRRVRQRRLHRVALGVYTVGPAELTPAGRRHAGVLAAGAGAVASHTAAAAAWGLAPPRHRIHVTVPRENRRGSSRLVAIHRFADLAPDDLEVVDGLAVTSVARTLVDLGAVVPVGIVRRVLVAAERERLLDIDAVEQVLARVGRRPGPAALRTVLRHYDPRWQHVRSGLELTVLDLIARHGLPRPEVDAGVLDRYIADFLWRDARLVVEMDSERFHTAPQDRRADARRDADLRRGGFTVLRVPERELEGHPESVAASIALALARTKR